MKLFHRFIVSIVSLKIVILAQFQQNCTKVCVIFCKFHGIPRQFQMFIKFWGAGAKPVQKPSPGPVAHPLAGGSDLVAVEGPSPSRGGREKCRRPRAVARHRGGSACALPFPMIPLALSSCLLRIPGQAVAPCSSPVSRDPWLDRRAPQPASCATSRRRVARAATFAAGRKPSSPRRRLWPPEEVCRPHAAWRRVAAWQHAAGLVQQQ